MKQNSYFSMTSKYFPPKAHLYGKTKYSPVISGYILYYIISQKSTIIRKFNAIKLK